LETQRPSSEWERLGVRLVDGANLAAGEELASIVQPGGAGGRAFLVGQNFRMILDWNRSSYFGVAVGLLADGIRASHAAP
jgi:membrane-bound lytic murein transglycosylase B